MDDDGRLLVVTLSNIGDVVLTTPVLEALAAHFPAASIDILGDARSVDILADAPYVGDLFVRHKRAGWRAQFALVQRLRQRYYRLIVDLRTPVIPYLLRAQQRLVKPSRGVTARHAAEEHFEALRNLLPQAAPSACRIYVGEQARSDADVLLQDLPGSRWLALAPGANWPGKKWPAAHFRALLTLARKHFDGAVILGSQDDAGEALAMKDAGMPVVITAGRTSLRQASAVIARTQAFVGNDSGLGHIAAALSVPTLTLFGAGDPTRYRPWGERARVVLAPDLDLDRLTPAAVCKELLASLAQTGAA